MRYAKKGVRWCLLAVALVLSGLTCLILFPTLAVVRIVDGPWWGQE